jgi:HEAT repeat protein
MMTNTDTPQDKKAGSVTDLIGAFAKEVRIDTRGDLEYELLRDLVKGFSSNPVVARRAMRELLSRGPAKFYGSALQIMKTAQDGAGMETMISLLMENDLLLVALADPEAFTPSAAAALARSLARIDPQLDSKLLKHVLRDEQTSIFDLDPARLERILAVLDAVSDSKRLVPILMKLQRHGDARVRSKAALLIVRAHRNVDWLQEQLNNADPRIRANAIEGLRAAEPSEKEIALLWKSTTDVHHRVASTALLVLFERGHVDQACEALEKMANSLGEAYRSAAAWAMGQTGDPRFLEQLRKMARSDVGLAKRSALKACVALTKREQSVQLGEA